MNRLVTDYDLRRPYEVSDGIEGRDKEHVYRLKFTNQPDDRIAVIVGDLLHNARSALNYLMRGLVLRPGCRSTTRYPVDSQWDCFLFSFNAYMFAQAICRHHVDWHS